MNICIFAASRDGTDKTLLSAAYKAGQLIAEAGHSVIFGGGSTGLMNACAQGVIASGGGLTGIAPRFFSNDELLQVGCDNFIYTDTMAERKELMISMSDAFIILPGGSGTLDEFFNLICQKQLGVVRKPVVFLNTDGYYDRLFSAVAEMIDAGLISESINDMFKTVSLPEEVLPAIT